VQDARQPEGRLLIMSALAIYIISYSA